MTRDTVMAQVEIQAGPHRFVSLLSREAADELGLEPGMLAVAAVKATNVSVEILCVPKTSSTSCDQAVFVDQATGVSLPSDAVPVEIDRFG